MDVWFCHENELEISSFEPLILLRPWMSAFAMRMSRFEPLSCSELRMSSFEPLILLRLWVSGFGMKIARLEL